MEMQMTQNSHDKYKKEKLKTTSFKAYFKVNVIKTMRYWFQDRQLDQYNKTEYRNRAMPVWPIDFQQWYKRNSVASGQTFQQMVLKQLDIHM